MSVDSEKLTMMMSEASGPINFTVFLEMQGGAFETWLCSINI